MKITNQLVTTLNVGLQDLFYEVGLLTRLEEFSSQKELEAYLNKEFVRFEVLDPANGTETDSISSEEKARDSLKEALTIVNIKSTKELLKLMNNRYNTSFKNSLTASDFAQTTRDRVATVVQIDRVLEGLERLGLSENARSEIVGIKVDEVNKLCDLLLVKVEQE